MLMAACLTSHWSVEATKSKSSYRRKLRAAHNTLDKAIDRYVKNSTYTKEDIQSGRTTGVFPWTNSSTDGGWVLIHIIAC